MKHRTDDKGFFPCPFCGKPPYVTIEPPYVAWAECCGTLFRRHDRIFACVVSSSPSKLWRDLAHDWNQAQFVERADADEAENRPDA